MPVEAQGRQHIFQRMPQAASQAVLDGRTAGIFGGARVTREEPQQDRQSQNQAARLAQEQGSAFDQSQRQAAQVGPAIGWQLQQQRRTLETALTCEVLPGLQQPRNQHGRHDRNHVQAKQHQPLKIEQPPDLALRNEGGNQQGVDRQPGGAGHQRNDENGQQPVAPVADAACGQNTRDVAGKARQQRYE